MRNKYWLHWTINCAIGEWIGIGFAGLLAFLANTAFGEPESLTTKLLVLLIMMLAGFIEGSALGYFQWRVLRQKFVKMPRTEWMAYTIAVAVLGWFLGMLPALFFISLESPEMVESQLVEFDNPIVFGLLSIGSGLILGAIFGLFQWFSLKKYAYRAEKWIWANALGWGIAIFWIFLFASLPNKNSSVYFIVFSGAMGGILAGLSLGAITGLFLLKMKEKQP